MRSALGLLISFPLWASSLALASSPELEVVLPRGVWRGGERELSFHGKRLFDPQEVIFYQPGIEVLQLRSVNPKVAKLRVRVAPDCALGEHRLRLRTAHGVSELRTLFVGDRPHFGEVEPNGPLHPAQPIKQDVTVIGFIGKEDVDRFALEGKAGARLSIDVLAQRLGGPLFDVQLTLTGPSGAVVASCDDGPGRLDPMLSLLLPEDGTYVITLRDASYGGGQSSRYLMRVGSFPLPLRLWPPGGKPGPCELTCEGDPLGPLALSCQVPAEPFAWLTWEAGDVRAPSALPFRVSALEVFSEAEPNQGRKRANPVTAPAAIHGRIDRPGDVDFFRFSAKKGHTFRVEAYSRRLGSPMDAVLNVFLSGGKHIVGNDDGRGQPDAALRFKAPQDGDYELRVRDFLNRGGPEFIYRVEVEPPRPALRLALQTPGRKGSQERQAIAVPRGNRFAVLVQATREGFGGAVYLELAGLPAGVSVSTPQLDRRTGVVPLVFEASAEAPLAATLAGLRGQSVGKQQVAGSFRQTVDLSVGPPNNAVYCTTEIHRLAVAVCEPAPFKLQLQAPKTPLVRGGTTWLEVTIERAAGFDAPVDLFPLPNPPGCGAQRRVQVPKGQTQARIPINANGRAGLGTWPLVVLGRGPRRGPLWVSSQVVSLEVAEPFVGMQLSRAAVQQGAATEIHAQVTAPRPWEGPAKARLMGLPPGVSAAALDVLPETKELRFALQATAAARPGRHRNIVCEVMVPTPSGLVRHVVGNTELRIDAPRPQAKAKPTKPTKPKRPAAPSRLEQLRDEFERQKKHAAEPQKQAKK